jgi:Pyruvate/2-oxoacid:ferredoxin oxidoreductase gamma subunit
MAIVNIPQDVLPDKINNLLVERNNNCFLINADDIARKKGMIQASNMAVLGFFARMAVEPYTVKNIENAIRRRVPGRVLEKNLEIFQVAYRSAHKI